MTFLASRPGYDARALLPHTSVQVWESLLVKLKEFELLHALPAPDDLCRAPRRDPHLARPEPASIRRLAPTPPPLPDHPSARFRGSVGRRPVGVALRPDLRHQRLQRDHLDSAALGRPRAGPLLPAALPVPAADQPARRPAPGQDGEVSRRRRVLLQPRGPAATGAGDPGAAPLPAGAHRGLPLLARSAHRAQLRAVSAPADPGRESGGTGALRVLRPRGRRAHPSDLRQNDAKRSTRSRTC